MRSFMKASRFVALSLLIALSPAMKITTAQADTKIILTSFPILQDITAHLAPEGLTVETLTPKGQDPHSYLPSARDINRLQTAALILVWGLGLDSTLENLIRKARPQAPLFLVTDNIATLNLISTEHRHGAKDPHLWQSPLRMVAIAGNISKTLQKTFPNHQDLIDKKTKSYVAQLQRLGEHYKNEFAKIPSENKKFLTPHQAFQYLAEDMGLKAVSVRGIDSQSDPSTKTIQKLIRALKQDKIRALFDEANSESRVLKRLSIEARVPIGGTLYTDTFPSGSGPQTYLQLIEHNLKTILVTLKKESP